MGKPIANPRRRKCIMVEVEKSRCIFCFRKKRPKGLQRLIEQSRSLILYIQRQVSTYIDIEPASGDRYKQSGH